MSRYGLDAHRPKVMSQSELTRAEARPVSSKRQDNAVDAKATPAPDDDCMVRIAERLRFNEPVIGIA
jgi:hypothetical protein